MIYIVILLINVVRDKSKNMHREPDLRHTMMIFAAHSLVLISHLLLSSRYDIRAKCEGGHKYTVNQFFVIFGNLLRNLKRFLNWLPDPSSNSGG